MNKYYFCIGSTFFCGILSCSVGPDFTLPQVTLPQNWDHTQTTQQQISNELFKEWWKKLEDPLLNSLIDRALEGNLDLKQAALRIEAARETVTISTSRFFPQINLNASFDRSRNAGNSDQNIYRSISRGGLDAAWEIDLFGGIRRDRESSLAFLESSEENFNAVRLELVSQLATTFIQLRATQQQLKIIEETVNIRRRRLALIEQRYAGGLTDAFDLTSAKADLQSLEARVGPLQSQREEFIYAIGVLLGKNPEELSAELSSIGIIPVAQPIIDISLPAETIARRPDIKRAEAELHAQTAQVGIATAALYPQISLTGSFSFQHLDLGSTSNDSRAFGFGPTVTLPIFNAGRLRAALRIQEIEQEIAFQAYQSTVIQALKEVETALVRFGTEQQRKRNLEIAVEENKKAVEYATQLFQNGLADYFRVILAQGALLTAQEQLLNAQQNVSLYLVSVYKALGGGWGA
jgi:outer membrane protein, multidrug efflux system